MSETTKSTELLGLAMRGLDGVRDAVVRTAQAGRTRLDLTLLRRERDHLYQRLGEQVFRLEEEGRMELPAQLHATVRELRLSMQRIVEQEARVGEILAGGAGQETPWSSMAVPAEDDAAAGAGDVDSEGSAAFERARAASFDAAVADDPDDPDDGRR